jgi:hypothetical protein
MITVVLVADAINEANETVILTMGVPTNATQGATTVHTATIDDHEYCTDSHVHNGFAIRS